jgi:hypothetical protein
MKKRREDPPDVTRQRLQIVQEYLHCKTQADFAHKLRKKASYLSLLMRENDTRVVPKSVAFTIWTKWGITTEWLWSGDRGGIPMQVLQELDQAEQRLVAQGKLPAARTTQRLRSARSPGDLKSPPN